MASAKASDMLSQMSEIDADTSVTNDKGKVSILVSTFHAGDPNPSHLTPLQCFFA